ncbi:MAG: four helix bundle protein [Deltaproteobacteria bacterium]|nr:four helix bundle protein [Deltaproteobacteria bacterium]
MNDKPGQLSDRLLDFAVSVIKITEMLPNTVAGRHVGGQLVRAGTSAGSNYEEACGAESRFDFAHKMSIVLKELKESRFWLRLIRRTRMLTLDQTNPIIDECEQLCAIVAKSIITTKKRKNSK